MIREYKKPHEYCARRVYGQRGVDWQESIDFKRLRKERLARARKMMKEHGLGALLCFNGENIRYITSVWQGQWKSNIFIRYCILPEKGEPVLFETTGADIDCALMDATWMCGRIDPASVWVWSGSASKTISKRMAESVKKILNENKINKEKVGLDLTDWTSLKALRDSDINVVNGWGALSKARLIKTKDELELAKQSATIAGAAFDKIREEWLKPGVRECEIAAKYSKFLIENGFEYVPALIVASGGNTNPYRRWATDKMVRKGDLVIIDIAGAGPSGYFCDFTRTFKCGGKFTEKEKEIYKSCLDPLNSAINVFKPGATTKEIAENFPKYDDDKFKTCSLFQFGHSIGLSLYEGMWISRGYSLDYPEEVKKNMLFSVETYIGSPHFSQGVRLEQSIVVTDTGYELYTIYPLENEIE